MTPAAIDLPLTRWYCDTCRQPIDDPQMANVCWEDPTSSDIVDGQLQHDHPGSILIVHKGKCDDMRTYTSNHSLDVMLGTEGMQWWATIFLWSGPAAESMKFVPSVDMKPVLDLFYRLHVPHYEQARRHFKSEEAIQSIKGRSVLTESMLKEIIDRAND